jgi:TPR repeat protein
LWGVDLTQRLVAICKRNYNSNVYPSDQLRWPSRKCLTRIAMSRRMIFPLLAALVSVTAVTLLAPTPAGASDSNEVIGKMVGTWPDWLARVEQCPADAMPENAGASAFSIEGCTAAVEQCLDRCRAGNAGDCYSAALVVQRTIKTGPLSDALFLRACKLGVASGCTNLAASMEDSGDYACPNRTYELACGRDDPWACTMMGFHLIRGIGVEKNNDRARRFLARSCRFGDTDEACAKAKAFLKEIGG